MRCIIQTSNTAKKLNKKIFLFSFHVFTLDDFYVTRRFDFIEIQQRLNWNDHNTS